MTEKTFIEVVDQHQRIIHKVCRMYRDRREDQEDLFQEIVYQLWKSFPRFRQEAKVTTWMYRIALNTAVAVFRKKSIPTDRLDNVPERYHPTEATDHSENEERMYEALRRLGNSERAIISLFLEDYSYQEIAEITGITENYVGVKINRIKNKLKAILN